MSKNKHLPTVSTWKSEYAYEYKPKEETVRRRMLKDRVPRPNEDPALYQRIYDAFSAKIRFLMKAAGLNQSTFAEELSEHMGEGGPAQSVVFRWYHARAMPKWEQLIAIKEFFGVSLDFLIDPSETNPHHLPGEETEILELVRNLGYESSKRRLLMMPDPIPASTQTPEPTLKPKPAQGSKKSTKPA